MGDWLLGLDPGYQRLRGTLRAVLSMAASVAVMHFIGRLMPVPLAAMILSGVAAMLASFGAGANAADRLLTATLLPLPILLAVSLSALTSAFSAWANYGILIGIVYAAVEARRFGARGTVLGMSCVMGFFLAHFLHVTISQLAPVALGLAVAAALAELVREVIVPTAPRATIRWSLRAFRAQGRHAARLMVRRLDGSHRAGRRAGGALKQLNVCALSVNAALGSPDAGVSEQRRAVLNAALTDAELVIERCARAVFRAPAAQDETLRAALDAVLHNQREKAKQLAHTLSRPAAPRTRRQTGIPERTRKRAWPVQTRQAIQATVACAAAIAVGQWLSPERWYWAMLAAFVVFAGTASAGETLRKLWSRVLGTALGAGAGIGIASLIGGDPVLDGATIVGLAALGLYLRPISYASMTFCITTVLGLLYTMLGESADRLLILRLEETAIGAFFGGLAAMMVLPVRTPDVINLAVSSYLSALDVSVAASVGALAGDNLNGNPTERARALDQQLHELLARSEPWLNSLPLMTAPQEQREFIVTLVSCSYYARHLARVSETAAPRTDGASFADYSAARNRVGNAIKVLTGASAEANPDAGDFSEMGKDAALHDLAQIAEILMKLAQGPVAV